MKSNPPDPGRPEGPGDGCELPTELADALALVRARLGRLASTVLYFETIGSTNDEASSRSAEAFALRADDAASRSAEAVALRADDAASRSAEAVALRADDAASRSAEAFALQPDGDSRSAKALAERSAASAPPQHTGATASPCEGLVIVADQQTSGRGRRGHTWFSPPGSGLYVSVVLAPATAGDPARATTLLTLAAGVALAEGIEAATGLRVDLKWPNDLQVSRRKLGGILAESSGAGDRIDTVVVGYGINVRPAAFPPELRDRATSLESELGRAVDRHHLLAETLAALARRYEDLLAGRFDAILDAWRRLAPAASGARVTWTTATGAATGITAGVDDRGALLVRTDGRVERIVSGEVIWL